MTKKLEVNENRKQLLVAVKELNGSGLLEEKIKVVGKGTGTSQILEGFVESVNALVNDGRSESLPLGVVTFYNTLAMDLVEDEEESPNTDEEGTDVDAGEEGGMVSELPSNKKELWKYIKDNKLDIKKEQGTSVEELQTKIKEEEDVMGKKKEEKKKEEINDVGLSSVKAKAREKKKTTEKKDAKDAAEKKSISSAEKNKWGHRVGTQADMIDNFIDKKTEEAIILASVGRGRLKAHIKHLESVNGMTVVVEKEKDKNIYKFGK